MKPRNSFFELLKNAFYIGIIAYGGPAILAQMKRLFVHKYEYISEQEFMDGLSLTQILPGSQGTSMMTYIGYKLHRFWGGIIVPFVFIAPSIVLVLFLSWAYFRFGDIHAIKSIFIGLGAVVVALLVDATLKLGKTVFKKFDRSDLKGGFIALLAFIAVFFFNMNAIYIILLSALLGFGFYFFTKEFEAEKPPKEGVISAGGQGLHFEKKDFLPLGILLVIVTSIFFVPLLERIFTTFFQVGLFTFGGGYTAVALIQRLTVEGLHWVTLSQFRDGIALGNITPGPVLETATFIGYHVTGIIGALVATFAIFLPSMLAMLLVVDMHEKVKNMKLVKVLTKGILSGFIGLLVAVTLQFAFKSLIGWETWLIFLAAVAFVSYFKKDPIWAILVGAGISLFIF
jgi:chromate transporter